MRMSEGRADDHPFSGLLGGARGEAALAEIRQGLIGEGMEIPGAGGSNPLIYADYTASGRALEQVESFIMRQVLPIYANSHSEDSFCGRAITALRQTARDYIARAVNAGAEDAVIFTGAGATAAINKMAALLDLANAPRRPLVLTGPYEHHSNILPWRESGAEVMEIPPDADGGIDLAVLEAALHEQAGQRRIIGSFSAASNVTGLCSDVGAVTALLKRYGALALWDYAAAGPYLPVDMNPGEGAAPDAVFISPHKFIGGPGASGVLVLKRRVAALNRPSQPGGGSVAFVSPWGHDYLDDLVEREEAGTPNIIGDIRAALAFAVKEAVGTAVIGAREQAWIRRAMHRWGGNPALHLLGNDAVAARLPIFSFLVRDRGGDAVCHRAFARTLSERYGIQVRSGCVCAGPYGHRLLGIGREDSERLRRRILGGDDSARPGWVRLSLHYAMRSDTVDTIINAVDELARRFHENGMAVPA